MNDLTRQYQQYRQNLKRRFAHKKGWSVSFDSDFYPGTVTVTCPCGDAYEEKLFPEALTKVPDTKGIADQCFRRALKFCGNDHEVSCPTDPALAKGGIVFVPAGSWKVSEIGSLWWGINDVSVGYSDMYSKYLNEAYAKASAGKSIYSELSQVVPALNTHTETCPVVGTGLTVGCGYGYTSPIPLGSLIPHINDVHKWSREQIADWLETLDVDLTIQPKGKHDDADTDEAPEYSPLTAAIGSGPSDYGWGDYGYKSVTLTGILFS